jgi:UDP-N-acetylglucosamine--N-acetylmuramyl-(pentapeptide) pyrophosphoryl-undecaprenol N-acetylglucosamine transferase
VAHFPDRARVEVTGCPVRSEFARADRAAGLAAFGLDPDRRTLLVTGASQGSRSVNRAVAANLDFLASRRDWQVLHLTGEADHDEVRAAYAGRPVPGRVIAYTERMADALSAADLVVSRAGASTLAEITTVGRASILMPYPHHRDDHQFANARCLTRVGAAEVIVDEVDEEENGPALRGVMAPLMDDHAARERMAAAANVLGRVDAADRIADRVLELASARSAIRSTESVKSAI